MITPHPWSRGLWERKVVRSLCRLSSSFLTVILPVFCSVLPLSHTCWQSALTCVLPVCTKAWRQKSRGIYFCHLHTYLACSQTGVVFMSQISVAKGKKNTVEL